MNKDNIDNIKVPKDISKYINEGIEKADKEIKTKKKKVRRRIAYMAAALTIIILTVGITNPVLAEDIPILKDIFKVLQHEKNTIIPEGDFTGNAKDLSLVKEDNGVKVTAQEIVYDGESIWISYKIEYQNVFPYKTIKRPQRYITDDDNAVIGGDDWIEEDIKYIMLDGEKKLSYIENDNENLMDLEQRIMGKFVDNKTYIGVVRYSVPDKIYNNGDIKNISVPDEFNLNLNLNKLIFPIKKSKFNEEITSEDKFVVEGEWNFSITIKKDAVMDGIITEINEVKDGFKLESITKYPFSTIIKIVPLNPENQKNIMGYGGKVQQLQMAILKDNKQSYYDIEEMYYGQSQPSIGEIPLKDAEVAGTIYMRLENSIFNKAEYFNIVVEDYIRIGQPCTKECENEEHHMNSPHPKQITFDTKIK